MADAADLADALIEADLQRRIRAARKPVPVLAAAGRCLNCGVKTRARWCGSDCRDAWEEDQR